MDKGIATIDESHAELLESMHGKGINFITISFGSPYLPSYSYLDTYIKEFKYNSPFPCVVIDNFLLEKTANQVHLLYNLHH